MNAALWFAIGGCTAGSIGADRLVVMSRRHSLHWATVSAGLAFVALASAVWLAVRWPHPTTVALVVGLLLFYAACLPVIGAQLGARSRDGEV